jgi:hypothetical protein
MVERSDIWMLILLKERGGSTDFGYDCPGSRGNYSEGYRYTGRIAVARSRVDNKTMMVYVWTRAKRGQ